MVVKRTSAPPTAEALNHLMGTGFNLGNTFDLQMNPTDPRDVRRVIDLYASAGMRHVRIPVTWTEGFGGDTLADSNGSLRAAHPRLKQLESAIDYALGKGMVVILNTHHERRLKEEYDGSSALDNRFARLWSGIANRFGNRSPKLIFEVLNEPEGAMGQWSGRVRPHDPVGLARTRQINMVGYRAIRSTGGANTTRVILVSPNGQGNHSMLDEVYPDARSLPGAGRDRFLMATVHTYDPWGFCGEDGKLEERPSRDQIRGSIQAVAAHARKLGIPVNYGEYGVGRRDRQGERGTAAVREYYRTVRETTLSLGMSNTPWDDRGWFGLIARNPDGKYRFTHALVPFMMRR